MRAHDGRSTAQLHDRGGLMKVIFAGYLTVIILGLAYFLLIGLGRW
jgi:hypothetical protein